ncbi:HipA family kinase [Pediococcus acidilactici]|uniref:HipA family kinase n=1 Tax=Pediococcus acidilactici TaxID=1254 RepID=UPI0033060E69
MTRSGSIPLVGINLNEGGANILSVVNVIEPIKNGYTHPFIVACSNNKKYVIKTKNDYTGNHKIEFNELISYRLACLLDLPIPNANIVNLPADIIENNEDMQNINVTSGPCFASEYRKGIPSITPLYLEKCNNTDDLPGILLFDQLLLNDDRGDNPGNLLFDFKTKKILIIDHSNVFKNASIWQAEELLSYRSIPPVTVGMDGRNYLYIKKFVDGNSPFSKIIEKIKTLSPDNIHGLFKDIPLEWEIEPEEIDACERFITFQLNHYSEILKKIHSQLPQWKGAG